MNVLLKVSINCGLKMSFDAISCIPDLFQNRPTALLQVSEAKNNILLHSRSLSHQSCIKDFGVHTQS